MPVKSTKVKKTVIVKKTNVAAKEVKKSTKRESLVDLRAKTSPTTDSKRNILTVHKNAPAIKSLRELPKFEIRHDESEDALIRHFELDDKIDFKKNKPKSLHIYRKISITFVILTSLLVAAIAYFSLVKVDISIVLNKEQAKGSAIVGIINAGQNLASTTDLVGTVQEVQVDTTKEFEATGKQILGTEVNGKIKLVNNYVRNQPLVANTRLVTLDNQLVRLKSTINVPAGGSVEADVYSSEATSTINIPADTQLIIPGLWKGIQDKIFATTLTQVTYQERIKKIVSSEDLASVDVAMQTEIDNKIKNDILPAYQGQFNKVLYKIVDGSVVTVVDAKEQEEKNSFTAKTSAKVAIVGFKDSDANIKVEEMLRGQLSAGKTLIGLDQGAITYELGNVDTVAGAASINIGYAGTVMSREQTLIDKSRILGLTAGQLEDYLRSLPEVNSYQIKFTPAFVGRVPYLINRISIDVAN